MLRFPPVLLAAIAAFSSCVRADPDKQDLALAVAQSARSQVGVTTGYDPSYRKLTYPGGDVPPATGVCADVVVRAFRGAGVDLQVLVHEDMAKDFGAYPQQWRLKAPDSNIDHRRVLNLMKFFERGGKSLKPTDDASDYLPGDVVAWKLAGGLYHIGVVSARRTPDSKRPLMVHNIGAGAQEEDVLFAFEVIGHYRYFGAAPAKP